jgi:hypothetical protein
MTRFLLLLLLLLPTLGLGATISLEFSVHMDWRFDLSTGAMDPSFHPVDFDIEAIVDDHITEIKTLPPDTTRILFGEVMINSPLSSILSMGLDTTNLRNRFSSANVQDTFVSPTNQGTWITLSEDYWGTDGSYAKWLQFNNLSRLSDPLNFSYQDFYNLLSSTVGQQYGYREDTGFLGGGFQNHGLATLNNISRTISAVPEPASGLLVIILGSSIAIWSCNEKHSLRSGPFYFNKGCKSPQTWDRECPVSVLPGNYWTGRHTRGTDQLRDAYLHNTRANGGVS